MMQLQAFSKMTLKNVTSQNKSYVAFIRKVKRTTLEF